ncbi:hypothetical protein COCON_G00144170 [Conger conger]|uniref:Uncharacterized protein n=1 Tax=Conger conger TaxID=82655 RepID=A0A9Q1DBG2_CONCO|nr:hypothetical protein COCON_G00144170 [Conger conger]
MSPFCGEVASMVLGRQLIYVYREHTGREWLVDGWTYITITAHPIHDDWKMESIVLQTRLLFICHIVADTGEELKSAV